MADQKISQLTAATTPLAGTEVVPLVQSGVTKKVSVVDLTAGCSVSVADLTATTGNIIIGTAGKGIDFSATAGTGTSELLADYEEGNWTPNVTCLTSGTITLSAANGFYTKIGRIVHVSARIIVDSVSSPNGIASINGLPFTSANNANASSAASLYLNGFAAGATPFIMGSIDLNATNIYMFQFVNGSRVDTMANQFQAGARLYLSATYTAA